MRVEPLVQARSEDAPRRWWDAGWSERLDRLLPERRVTGPIIAVALAVMWLLVTDGRPWNLFATGGFSSDFYDAQADAFVHGRMDVDPDVAQMEGVDMDGKIYLYYGVFLSVARLPVALVTDSLAGQLTRFSILVAFAVALFAAAHLAHAARRVTRPDAPGRQWRMGVFVAAVAVSPALFAGGWLTVYHETEIWAFALALVALAAAVRLRHRPSTATAIVAAVAASLCTLTRASVGVGATAAVLVALGVAYRWQWRPSTGPAVLAVMGGLIHAWVNWARFGDPVSIPVDRQIINQFDQRRADWLADHGDSIFSSEFVPSTLWHYLRPDAIRFDRLVPFVRFGPPADQLGGIEFESNTPSTSLTVSATLLCVLAVIGLIWLVRQRRWPPVAMALAMGLGTVPTFAIGFVANRYLIDLLAPLALLGAYGVWTASAPGRVLKPTAAVLVGWGLLVNVSLALWIAHGETVGFTKARYQIDQLLPAPAPGLVELPPDGDVPRLGTVALDRPDGCKAVYIVSKGDWVPLERSEGYRNVTGTVTPGSTTTLVDAGPWSLTAEPSGDVVYRSGPSELVIVTLDPTTGEDAEYEVVVDPITDDRFLSIGDEFGFLPTEVLTSTPLDQSSDSEPGELCRLLNDRLG